MLIPPLTNVELNKQLGFMWICLPESALIRLLFACVPALFSSSYANRALQVMINTFLLVLSFTSACLLALINVVTALILLYFCFCPYLTFLQLKKSIDILLSSQ